MDDSIGGRTVFWVLLLACLWGWPGFAEVYQYQDSHGNWIFTDSPPPDTVEDATIMDGMVTRIDGARDLKSELEKVYEPQNGVSAAALATITIKSAIGTGSGFFVSDQGHLITNRHVIYGDERQNQAMTEAITWAEDRIAEAEKEFELAKQQLVREQDILSEMKAVLEKLPEDSAQRKTLEPQYNRRLAYYREIKKDVEKKEARFEKEKASFQSERSGYESRQARAGVSRHFEITLKTGETLQAWLMRTATDHDLALLKVDGIKTPFIPAAERASAAQGQKVFAIGSPLNFRDTIQDGIVTGFSKGFIQTNAAIYPGNSGGPLVDESGQAVGINTFKELTRNFEGMGFAIPIHTALEEFSGEMR